MSNSNFRREQEDVEKKKYTRNSIYSFGSEGIQRVHKNIEGMQDTIIQISEIRQTPSEQDKTLRLWPTTIVLLTYMFIFAYIIPIYPVLLLEAVNMNRSMAARWNGYSVIIKSVLDFISLPIIGAASDIYGRKPFLVMSLVSISIQVWILVFNGTNLTALVTTRVLSGMTDGVMTLSFAAITDITNSRKHVGNVKTERMNGKEEDNGKRQKGLSTNYGIVGAVFGIAFVLGPAFGGAFSYWFGIVPAIAVVGVLVTAMTLYTFFYYEETLDESNRIPRVELKRLNPFETLTVLIYSDALRSLAIPLFFYDLSFSVNSLWMLWVKFRFDWQILQVGGFLSGLGLSIAIFQGIVIRIVPKCLSERDAVVYGYIACGVYYFLAGLSPRGWMLYLILLIIGYGSLSAPCLRATLSSHVADSDQGLLQGSLDSVTTVSRIIGGLLYGLILSWSEDHSDTTRVAGVFINGAINFVAAFFMIPAFVFATSALKLYAIEDTSVPLIIEQPNEPTLEQFGHSTIDDGEITKNESIVSDQDTTSRESTEQSSPMCFGPADIVSCGIKIIEEEETTKANQNALERACQKTKRILEEITQPSEIIHDGHGLT